MPPILKSTIFILSETRPPGGHLKVDMGMPNTGVKSANKKSKQTMSAVNIKRERGQISKEIVRKNYV